MNNGYYYQLLGTVIAEGDRYSFPRYLKDQAKKGDIENVDEMLKVLAEEAASAPLTGRQEAEYFTLIAESGMMFCLYRQDYQAFRELYETASKRINLLKGQDTGFDVASWEQYFQFVDLAARRIARNISIEKFETGLEDFEWSEIEHALIYRISGLAGYVYLKEEDELRVGKSRHWLEKAVAESDLQLGLVYTLNLADFSYREGNSKRIEEMVKAIELEVSGSKDKGYTRLLNAALLELQARALIHKFESYDDEQVKLEESLASVRQVEKEFDLEGKDAPAFVRAFLKMEFASFYLEQVGKDLDSEDLEDLLTMAHDDINDAIALAKGIKDAALQNHNKLNWLAVVCERSAQTNEKEIKDIVSTFKKTDFFPDYVTAVGHYVRYHQNQGNPQKAYDVLIDLVKAGQKRMPEGGFYYVVHAMEGIDSILLEETTLPGVSWMVNELVNYFDLVMEVVDAAENYADEIGRDLLDQFRMEYMRFEPVSHFNIYVYFRYQWYGYRLMRLNSIFAGDEIGVRQADAVLKELEHENNPLSFVKADWDEFKNVPNSVRNKTLNKCISISKGDLPLAAELMDFSYRNLRSYITFKEVNRLGFFLDHQETNYRQLEQGIRLMFFDLYKRGTIFEVVFDMPKFLVEYAKSGFSSQDLEEALNIKGTTAKKYIKIMMEIDLIKHERSVGRKHFYKLRKDNVMNRLGKDQQVLVV